MIVVVKKDVIVVVEVESNSCDTVETGDGDSE